MQGVEKNRGATFEVLQYRRNEHKEKTDPNSQDNFPSDGN